MKIGFIGAGEMGRPMLDHLIAAGHDVTVLTRRAQTRTAAEADGLTCADTITETVRDADAVFVVVLKDAQVRSVCLDADGALAGLRPGATLIQHTTCDPLTVRDVAEAGARRGIRVLDAALSGGPRTVAAGQLTLWVGGDEAVLDEFRPVLGTYATPILHVGEIGNGQRTKLVNNALFVSQVGLAIDAVRLAASLGLEEAAVTAAISHGSGASFGLTVVAELGSVDAVPAMMGDLMRKDVDTVRAVAANVGAELGLLGAVLASDEVAKKVLGDGGGISRASR